MCENRNTEHLPSVVERPLPRSSTALLRQPNSITAHRCRGITLPREANEGDAGRVFAVVFGCLHRIRPGSQWYKTVV